MKTTVSFFNFFLQEIDSEHCENKKKIRVPVILIQFYDHQIFGALKCYLLTGVDGKTRLHVSSWTSGFSAFTSQSIKNTNKDHIVFL